MRRLFKWIAGLFRRQVAVDTFEIVDLEPPSDDYAKVEVGGSREDTIGSLLGSLDELKPKSYYNELNPVSSSTEKIMIEIQAARKAKRKREKLERHLEAQRQRQRQDGLEEGRTGSKKIRT